MDRIFLFNSTANRFDAFQFDGTALTTENWNPGLSNLQGAAANDTHIFALDASAKQIRVWNAARSRLSSSDFALNNNANAYRGIALTDTHLVALNNTTNKLEYYSITTGTFGTYDSTKDVTLPNASYQGICRGGNNLFILDVSAPQILKRTLAGAADTSWAVSSNAARSLVATTDTVFAIHQTTGVGDAYDFDGTAQTDVTFAAGNFIAAYSTFAPSGVTIEIVSEQNIIVGTEDYELALQTTGVTEAMKIRARGDWEGGFYQDWDQSTGIIKIKNKLVNALRTGKTWILDVDDAGTIVATRSVSYNVVGAVPVIDAVDPITIYKGLDFSRLIPVANRPTDANINAELVGMKVSAQQDGALVEGLLPSDAVLDFDSLTAPLTASNVNGNHSRNVTFNIKDGLIYALSNSANSLQAWNLQGTRQSSDDISLGAGAWHGVCSTSNRIYVIYSSINTYSLRAWDLQGTRQSSDDISLVTGTYFATFSTSNRIYAINDTTNTAVAYDHSGTRQSSDDISLVTGGWYGAFSTSNRIYALDGSTNYLRAWDLQGTRQSSDDISLGAGAWNGATLVSNRIYVIDTTADSLQAWDLQGTRQSSDDISLGIGTWNGATFVEL